MNAGPTDGNDSRNSYIFGTFRELPGNDLALFSSPSLSLVDAPGPRTRVRPPFCAPRVTMNDCWMMSLESGAKRTGMNGHLDSLRSIVEPLALLNIPRLLTRRTAKRPTDTALSNPCCWNKYETLGLRSYRNFGCVPLHSYVYCVFSTGCSVASHVPTSSTKQQLASDTPHLSIRDAQ